MTQNRLPLGCTSSTQILPWNMVTILRHTKSPIPVPLIPLFTGLLARTNFSKTLSLKLSSMPAPLSSTQNLRTVRVGSSVLRDSQEFHAEPDPPLLRGIFDGIGDEILHEMPQEHGVPKNTHIQ